MATFIIKAAVLGSMLAASLWAGAALQNHHETALAEQHANDPYAVIATLECGKVLGAVTVKHDGTVVWTDGAQAADIKAAAKGLPERSLAMLKAPCGKPKDDEIT
jgi:hypothetical protein